MDRRTATFLAAGLVVTALVAGVVSTFASREPDGLEKVSIDQGLDATAVDHGLSGSPLADYGVAGVEDERVSTGLAGIIGAVIALAVMVGLLYAARAIRRRRDAAAGG